MRVKELLQNYDEAKSTIHKNFMDMDVGSLAFVVVGIILCVVIYCAINSDD